MDMGRSKEALLGAIDAHLEQLENERSLWSRAFADIPKNDLHAQQAARKNYLFATWQSVECGKLVERLADLKYDDASDLWDAFDEIRYGFKRAPFESVWMKSEHERAAADVGELFDAYVLVTDGAILGADNLAIWRAMTPEGKRKMACIDHQRRPARHSLNRVTCCPDCRAEQQAKKEYVKPELRELGKFDEELSDAVVRHFKRKDDAAKASGGPLMDIEMIHIAPSDRVHEVARRVRDEGQITTYAEPRPNYKAGPMSGDPLQEGFIKMQSLLNEMIFDETKCKERAVFLDNMSKEWPNR